MKENNYALIMAGGVGSRFWPVSRESLPKQFHDLLGSGRSLLQSTYDRLEKIVPAKNIYILTNEKYEELVIEQLTGVSRNQLILEPAMRNTAPCLLLASLKIHKLDPEAKMIVAPSDHWIQNEEAFIKNVKTAWQHCDDERLMTIGIAPTFPNTGYGYIEFEDADASFQKVVRFTEKPDHTTAKEFYDSGKYLWNSGMFLWKAKAILNAFKKHAYDMYALFNTGYEILNSDKEKDFLLEEYPKAENISIDFAILENARKIGVVRSNFEWNDLGTWGSLYDQLPKDDHKNALVDTEALMEDTHGNIIRTTSGKKVVIDGIKDHIIVESNDVLLIIPRSKEQDIKRMRSSAIDKFGTGMK